MSALKTAVLRQIAYAKSIRSVIRAILRRMLDGEWINHIFASSDDEFNAKLDEAFKALDVATATKDDYCRTVAEVLCGEVSRLCMVLKDVCEGGGYGEYFASHISHERFVRLVLSTDTLKLGKMRKVLEKPGLGLIDVLREIGAVLHDESPEERTALGAKERRRADSEIKSLVKETKKAIDAVGEKVDSIASKVKRGGRRVKYDDETVAFCMACVDAAKSNAEVRNSTKTKMTLKAVYKYHRRKLESRGVGDFEEFLKIVHAYRARESRDRVKKLESHKSAAKPNTPRGKNGIIRP